MSSPKAGKTNAQAREDSERELLAAGVAELHSVDRQVNPMSHLKVRAICDRAGRTSGAFYMHWPEGIEAYQQALGEHLLADVAGMSDELAELADVAQAARMKSTVLEAVREVALEDLRLLLSSESWDVVELLTLTWGRDPGRLQDAAIRGYREADSLTFEAYGAVLEAFGRSPRSPLESKDIAVLLQAFIEGYGLRIRVDPSATDEQNPGRLYATGIAALLLALTAEAGDERTVDEMLAQSFGSDAARTPPRKPDN